MVAAVSSITRSANSIRQLRNARRTFAVTAPSCTMKRNSPRGHRRNHVQAKAHQRLLSPALALWEHTWCRWAVRTQARSIRSMCRSKTMSAARSQTCAARARDFVLPARTIASSRQSSGRQSWTASSDHLFLWTALMMPGTGNNQIFP